MSNNAPTTDPRLVSYQRPELRSIRAQLDRASDCWELIPRDGTALEGSVRGSYLPRELGEPYEAYMGRIGRSSYPALYRNAIRSFAGLLTRFQLIKPPQSLEAAANDIDLRGSSLRRFLSDVDQYVLRDGAAAILVEMPAADPAVTSAIEERKMGRRPYLVVLQRSQVINWRSHLQAGREVLDLVVIRIMENASDGSAYGSTSEEIFLVMVPGAWRKVSLETSVNGSFSERLIEEGTTSQQAIPLAWIGATSNEIGHGDVVMDGLASLSIEHMQLRSDLAELIHKCALPAGVRIGDSLLPDGSPRPLMIGPNSVLDLPEGGSFSWAEINGSSLQRHQEEVAHVESLMRESSLSFLWGDNSKNRTATEAALASGQVGSQVRGLIEGKRSAFRQVMEFWAAYSGEELSPESAIAISEALVERPLDSLDVAQVISLHTNELISHRTTLAELQRGGILDPDLDVEEEIQRVADERAAAVAVAHAALVGTAAGEGGAANDPATFAPQP